MKNRHILTVLLGLLLLAPVVLAQNTISWQAWDATGAGTSMQGTRQLYSSTGQSAVRVSTGISGILNSGYLFIRVVPSGAPTIVAQSSLDFGGIIVGQNSVLPLSVQNTGAAPLQISTTTISPSVYTILSGGGAQTIAPGGSVTMQIRFQPAAAGAIGGSLVIANNSAVPNFTVTLNGTGVATAPDIQLSATSLDFGAPQIGLSTTRTVTISNAGNAPLNITGQNIGGTDAAMFLVTHPSAGTITGGGNDYVEIRFTPSSAGVKNARLTITSNDPDLPSATVFLSGTGSTGAVPHISVQSSLDFGSTAPSTPVTRDLVIQNTGTAPLQLSGQTVSGTYFTLQTAAGTTISAGGSSTARLQFNPTVVGGPYNGTFEIASNDPSSPAVTVTLRGSCSPGTGARISFSTSVLDFGNVPQLTSKELDLVVTNIGSANLVLTNQVIAGTDANQFSFVQPATTPIPPSGTSTVRIRCTGLTGGNKIAKLQIQSNDAGLPNAEVVLVAIVTDVKRLPQLPSSIDMHQNYPNPFNPSTTIEYEIDVPGQVEVMLYDIHGKYVTTLDRMYRTAGTYRIRFDATDMASGIYTAVLRVQTRDGMHVDRIHMMYAK